MREAAGAPAGTQSREPDGVGARPAMDAPRRLLILGASGVRFSQPGQPRTLPELIGDELASCGGTAWKVEAEVLYPTADMAPRLSRALGLYEPEALLLLLGATVFAEESVMFGIRRRWPRLYPACARLISRAKALGGGGKTGSESMRGALFRAPAAIAARLLGTRPLVDPEAALTATVEALERIAAAPRVAAVCRLANGHFQHEDQRQEVERRTSRYNQAVRDACARLGIAVYGQREAMAELGWQYDIGPDGLHTDYETRQRAAMVAARQLLLVTGDSL